MIPKNFNRYHTALRSLLAKIGGRINIVVVGANDGKTNDPIYDFVMKNLHSTNILLIEPNKTFNSPPEEQLFKTPLLRICELRYRRRGPSKAPHHKQEFWGDFQPAYAKIWPHYRAATGLTSTNKQLVERALLAQNLKPEDAIETINVQSMQLKKLTNKIRWNFKVDVLQIDAEGYDDKVIYNSNLNEITPEIIYFESHNLGDTKFRELKNI